jgi:hypothetical protein
MALDWRNRADVAIIITTVTVAAVVFGTVITSGAIVAVGSVVGVPIIIFVRWPGAQETPFPGHVIIVIFIFQFPVEEELEVLAVGQGLIVLWPGPEVPLLCVPVRGAQTS